MTHCKLASEFVHRSDMGIPLLRMRGRGFALSCVLFVLGCTDTGLYKTQTEPFQANKLTISGTVCTDDPRQRDFPMKVLFLIDSSDSLSHPDNDNAGIRAKAVKEAIGRWTKSSPNFSFGIVSFGPQTYGAIQGGFTRDTSLLNAAADRTVQGSASGCQAGRCRDIRAAISRASSMITGDVLANDPGQVARTTYVIVLFSGGPPVPPISRCACMQDQETTGNGNACPWAWTECNEDCQVSCPSDSTCESASCYPTCSPPCVEGMYCDTDHACKPGSDRPTLTPVSTQPIPDTFTEYLKKTGTDSCEVQCVYDQGGNPDSCEERQLVSLVRELKEFVKENGATGFQFHTTYLPDQVQQREQTDPFYPPCGSEADKARTVRLLSEIAYTGAGSFQEFREPAAISFSHINLFTTDDPLVIKELVVTNANVLPSPDGLVIDSDQDGIDDETEYLLGTCHLDPDTDGDGISDAIELKLASDSTIAENPIACVDLDRFE
ncbi:MAG: vWA domain-containing protein, partial [Pseudomonadota bacterium]